MTNSEALKIVNVNGYGYPESDVIEAYKIIGREMRFRIKKPPIPQRTHGTAIFVEALCPACGGIVYGTEDACSKCGQLLDWTEAGPEV